VAPYPEVMVHDGRTVEVAGMVLTGGGSRRMGATKSSLLVGGHRLADRVGSALAAVTSPSIEVGPGESGLPAVCEDPRGQGPLVAIVCGWAELVRMGHRGPVLVVAVDLPLVTTEALGLVARWPGSGSVVPVVDGRQQPLFARWSVDDLEGAVTAAASGSRSLKGCFGAGLTLLGEEHWGGVTDGSAFVDVDTPQDLARLGLGHQGEDGEVGASVPPTGRGTPSSA